MKALSVHGDGAVFANTSCNVGRRGQYGPPGIARLNGLDISPDDTTPSSSASQSDSTDEAREGASFITGLARYNEGGFRCFDFDLRIALPRYFMGTQCRSSFLFQQTGNTTANAAVFPAPMLVCEPCL